MRVILCSAILATVISLQAQQPVASPRTAQNVGPALPEQVVDLYIPPTRANRPIASTMSQVYFLSPEQTSWVSLYAPSLQDQPIVATRGYAKSSKALFIVHKGGIAVTKTGEGPWAETRINGFSAATFVDLVVHPEDRKSAFLVTRNAAWFTENSGERWAAFEMPGSAEEAVGISFATDQDQPVLVYATNNSVYRSDAKFRDWTTLSREPNGPQLFHASNSFATVQLSNGTLRGYDLSRPGYTIEQPFTTLGSVLTTDDSGLGTYYFQEGSAIHAGVFGSNAAPSIAYSATGPIHALTGHPRLANAVYWVEGNQVRLLENVLESFPATPIPSDQFTLNEVEEDSINDTKISQGNINSSEAAIILNDIIAIQPPLEEVVEKALKFSSYSDTEAEEWKANVRRKNLVPEIVVGAGATERGLGRNRTVQNVDRFGVATTDDIRQDDTTEYMGNYGVELRWNLGGLIFDKEQLMVSEETRKRNEARNALITQVTDLYYRRIELLVQMKLGKDTGTLENAVQSQLRLRELTDSLNALVGSEVVRDY